MGRDYPNVALVAGSGHFPFGFGLVPSIVESFYCSVWMFICLFSPPVIHMPRIPFVWSWPKFQQIKARRRGLFFYRLVVVIILLRFCQQEKVFMSFRWPVRYTLRHGVWFGPNNV